MRIKDAIYSDIYGEKISDNISIDNNGQLICSNCVAARTGYYDYRESELFEGGSDNKVIRVYRSDEEVFDEKALKSFNFKPLVDDHPEDNVTPDTVNSLQKGFMVNARRGEGEFRNCVLVDLVVTDPKTIDLIKSNKKRDLSMGYTSDIEEDGKGSYIMTNIRGNHIALVDVGRAGIAKIRDSEKQVGDAKTVSLLAQEIETNLGKYNPRLLRVSNKSSKSGPLYYIEVIKNNGERLVLNTEAYNERELYGELDRIGQEAERFLVDSGSNRDYSVKSKDREFVVRAKDHKDALVKLKDFLNSDK